MGTSHCRVQLGLNLVLIFDIKKIMQLSILAIERERRTSSESGIQKNMGGDMFQQMDSCLELKVYICWSIIVRQRTKRTVSTLWEFLELLSMRLWRNLHRQHFEGNTTNKCSHNLMRVAHKVSDHHLHHETAKTSCHEHPLTSTVGMD